MKNKNNVKPVPDGYHTITPYLIVENGNEVIEFMKKAFNAKELYRMEGPNGTVRHSELQIGDSRIMLTDSMGEMKPMPCMLHLYVEDADTLFHQAVLAGAKSIKEPADQFYGDRGGGVEDPSGNQWWISTHIEDVSEEELNRRVEEMANK